MVDISGMLHEVNRTFNTSLQASTELINTTCLLASVASRQASHLRNLLGKHPSNAKCHQPSNANGAKQLLNFYLEPGDNQS